MVALYGYHDCLAESSFLLRSSAVLHRCKNYGKKILNLDLYFVVPKKTQKQEENIIYFPIIDLQMFKDILSLGKKPVHDKNEGQGTPQKEPNKKYVSAQRFNEMIDYYTAELQSRLKEIEDRKTRERLLINTSVKSNEKADSLALEMKKLREELRILQQRFEEKSIELGRS